MAHGAVAVVTGAVLGLAAVFFGYPGALAATVVVAALAAYYTRLRRYADVGWLLIGAGVVVVALLGRILALGLMDPSATISLPTYLGVAAGLLLLGTGAMVLGVSSASRRRG